MPGGSLTHALWAGAGFAALVAWPAGAWRQGLSVPWRLRPGVSAVVFLILLCLLAWFLAELMAGGGQAGLAERVMGRRKPGGRWRWSCPATARRISPARTPPIGAGLRRSGTTSLVTSQHSYLVITAARAGAGKELRPDGSRGS
jgi:hypothetical protein